MRFLFETIIKQNRDPLMVPGMQPDGQTAVIFYNLN